jgi:hypothetical protein
MGKERLTEVQIVNARIGLHLKLSAGTSPFELSEEESKYRPDDWAWLFLRLSTEYEQSYNAHASGEDEDLSHSLIESPRDWEKIRVPAGEFEALKIVVDGLYGGEETGTNGGSGHLTETIWFVPELNNFVKLDYQDTDWQGHIFNRDSWELISYVRKAPPLAAAH